MNLLIHDIAAAIERDATEGHPLAPARVDHSRSATVDPWADQWRDRLNETPVEPRRRLRPLD